MLKIFMTKNYEETKEIFKGECNKRSLSGIFISPFVYTNLDEAISQTIDIIIDEREKDIIIFDYTGLTLEVCYCMERFSFRGFSSENVELHRTANRYKLHDHPFKILPNLKTKIDEPFDTKTIISIPVDSNHLQSLIRKIDNEPFVISPFMFKIFSTALVETFELLTSPKKKEIKLFDLTGMSVVMAKGINNKTFFEQYYNLKLSHTKTVESFEPIQTKINNQLELAYRQMSFYTLGKRVGIFNEALNDVIAGTIISLNNRNCLIDCGSFRIQAHLSKLVQ